MKTVKVDTSSSEKFGKLNTLKFGLAGGITAGFCMMLTTILGIYGLFSEYNNFIVSIYGLFGYSISWIGVFLGAIYGFIDAFLLTAVFAWVYNKLL
jgi:hypothetical protein